MKTLVQWIDVGTNLLSGTQPVLLIERELAHGDRPKGHFQHAEIARTGVYWVPQSSVIEPDVKWGFTKEGQWVRIPVFAFRTRSRGASSILATGLEVGMAAIDELRQHTSDRPQTAILVLGHECTDLVAENSFRCYVGVGLVTKQ